MFWVFFNHSKCFSWIWGGFIHYSDITPTVSGPGRVGEQHSKRNKNVHLCKSIISKTYCSDSQCTEACRRYWPDEVQAKQMNRKKWKNVCRSCSKKIHKLLICLKLLLIIVSAAFRKCSNVAGRETGNPESRFIVPAQWEKMTCWRREPEEGMCRLVEMKSDYLNITFKQGNLFVRIGYFARRSPHHLPCFKCSTLSSQQTVSSRFLVNGCVI